MKLLITFILIYFIVFKSLSQDILLSHDNNVFSIYVANANIRKNASIDSKIIGKGKKGDLLDLRYNFYNDTINGVAGVWKKVLHNEEYGYVWGELTSQSATFKSQEFIEHSFTVWVNKENKIAVKLTENDTHKNTFFLPNTSGLKFYSAFSLGRTYNSDNKDVFVFYFGDYDSLVTKYYQWDGVAITPFTKKLKDDSFSNYNLISGGVITENVVNLRAEPSVKSEVIKV